MERTLGSAEENEPFTIKSTEPVLGGQLSAMEGARMKRQHLERQGEMPRERARGTESWGRKSHTEGERARETPGKRKPERRSRGEEGSEEGRGNHLGATAGD